MSCDQLTLENKIGVKVDSFSTQSALQYMSRRCIMNLSIQATRIAGLASSSLFCTASACTSITRAYPSPLTSGEPTCLTGSRLIVHFVI